MVPSARRFVRGILAGCPRADDLELIAAELISNAILHTSSGDEGGEFTVCVRTGNRWARIEVTDAGTGEWHPPQHHRDEGEHGRGLAIVAAIAKKLGLDVGVHGRTVRAEVAWPGSRTVEAKAAEAR
jgi:anti-sigma regulatory factor (Ser/Thr protein kinase)